MKKWIGPILSFFLILILGISLVSDFFSNSKKTIPGETTSEGYRIILIQDEETKREADSHMLQVLKEIQKKLDDWLKSLNERIESEDITRFEVRFFEILRNILEWIKEKVDAKIESYEMGKPGGKGNKKIFRETHREISEKVQKS
jgi:hypothetical protein